MAQAFANIAIKLFGKLLTERFMGKMVVLALQSLAKSTSNQVDDALCKAVGEALGVPCEID